MPLLEQPKVLCLIPARYGSARFPGKLMIPILGKTLIQRTFENVKKCPLIHEIIIATDDRRIYDHVESFGGKAVMTSLNCETGTDRIAEAIENNPHLKSYPIVLNVQGDEPCLAIEVINNVIKVLVEDPKASMSTAAAKITSEEEALDIGVCKCVFDKFGNALYFSRSLIPSNTQNLYLPEITYYRHIGIYGFRLDFLLHYKQLSSTPLQQTESLEQLKVLEHGYSIKVAVVEDFSVGVNYPHDIKKVEQILCKQNTSLSQAESVLL